MTTRHLTDPKVLPTDLPHVMYKDVVFADDYGSATRTDRCRTMLEYDAEIVSSKLDDKLFGTAMHAPCIDLDIPAALVPSSTPGHFHLYIDKVMPWRKYKRLLKAMVKAGLVEEGYYKVSCRRKETHLRVPWVRK